MIVVKNKEELKKLINKRIAERGHKCNLNDIDVSKVTDMSHLFYRSKFNGDISRWDVSNVKDMSYMFYFSDFNLSEWVDKEYQVFQWLLECASKMRFPSTAKKIADLAYKEYVNWE